MRAKRAAHNAKTGAVSRSFEVVILDYEHATEERPARARAAETTHARAVNATVFSPFSRKTQTPARARQERGSAPNQRGSYMLMNIECECRTR